MFLSVQLDYGVTWQKLKDVFKVAGRIVNADILTDREGKSKGLGEVQFEDPNEAISAIGESKRQPYVCTTESRS